MMAANNYFGFTHGGTQYGAATASAAYGTQTGYAVAPAASTATYGTQRATATGYDTAYQAAAATQAAHAQAHAHAAAAAASAYDASKTAYYQQAAAAYPTPAAPPAATYDTQPAKTQAYTQPYQVQNIACVQGAGRAGAGKPYAYSAAYPAATYSSQPAPPAKPAAPRQPGSAYDTALYNAATMYVAQQSKGAGWKSYTKLAGGKGADSELAPQPAQPAGPARRPKPPAKAQQLHYCDVCRISCAGPQTYKEHLEGQKHKKREAAAKLAARAAGGAALRCELCDVTCTGQDAYAAHVRGIKHQKVVKLHTMLGKPIPSTEPTKLGVSKKAVGGAAKIAFVASGGLSTVTPPSPTASPSPEPDVAPVGHDYIEELRADDGKPLSFNCKLCDCRFNDPNAKEMHMKGRRHRLQYKKKVQPDLEVKVKPSLHQRKLAEQKAARLSEPWWEPEWWRPRRPDSADDRAVAAKHAALYPAEPELRRLQRAVSCTERALKALSDAQLNASSKVKKEDSKDDKNNKEDGRDNQLFSFGRDNETPNGGAEAGRALKGVMRVGLLAKGLLLKGDRDVRLVVLCRDRPTVSLLQRVAAELPRHLAALQEDARHRVELQAAEGAVLVSDGHVNVKVMLTSALMRDPPREGGDDKDVLPRAKCLAALAALRHAKWFQARAANVSSCVIVLRILRDVRRRLPAWSALGGWALQLLAAGALGTAGALAPGEALRRVLEVVAGGALLVPGAPGLRDPCEKDGADAAASLTPQAREDVTASAQHALRQIAFRQIHKVLDMEPLPKLKHPGPWKFPRKRRRSNTEVEGEGKVVKTEDKMDTSEGGK